MKKIVLVFFSFCALFSFGQNALDFDGINDYVATATGAPTGSANRTVECWIKTSANQATQQVIFDYGAMSPLGSRFTLNIINFGKLRIEVGGNGFNSTQSIADGLWHHIAVTYDNAAVLKFKLYIDGQMVANQNTTQAVNTASTSVILGRRNDAVNYFDGVIDELRIWNVVRTPAQISAAMNSEFCAVQPGLIAYYTFNQGIAAGTNTGITTLTNGATSNNGTLNNFALMGSSSNWVTGKALVQPTPSVGVDTVVACDSLLSPSGSYVWTTNGNYTDTITSLLGCDSIVNVNLTLNNSSSGQLAANGCNSYTSPSGNYIWTSSGTYLDKIPNAQGCDSVLTINLTITSIDDYVLQNGVYLTANMTGANYQWLDCTNGFSPISGATNRTYQATANGSYAVQITQNGCSDTSDCYNITTVSVPENHSNLLAVYPNPAKNKLVVEFGATVEQANLSLLDMTGKTVMRELFKHTPKAVLNLNCASGIYFLKVEMGSKQIVKKVTVR
jgi:hypothetical protein